MGTQKPPFNNCHLLFRGIDLQFEQHSANAEVAIIFESMAFQKPVQAKQNPVWLNSQATFHINHKECDEFHWCRKLVPFCMSPRFWFPPGECDVMNYNWLAGLNLMLWKSIISCRIMSLVSGNPGYFLFQHLHCGHSIINSKLIFFLMKESDLQLSSERPWKGRKQTVIEAHLEEANKPTVWLPIDTAVM